MEQVLKLTGIVILTAFIILAGYNLTTTQMAAHHFGGKMTINLNRGEKLEEITWKNNNLWVVTTKRDVTKEQPKIHHFREHSPFGVIEGDITIIEH